MSAAIGRLCALAVFCGLESALNGWLDSTISASPAANTVCISQHAASLLNTARCQ